MKTLLRPADRSAIHSRLARVRKDSERRWGRMTAPQMICHLTDAFRGVLGERPAAARAATPNLFARTAFKWIALYAPMPWPRGIRTRPEADQERGGTPPIDFAQDVAALEAACERFLNNLATVAGRPHFAFGSLTQAEWARWAYLHMDHHLRQFGV
jgi:hypothetical protein